MDLQKLCTKIDCVTDSIKLTAKRPWSLSFFLKHNECLINKKPTISYIPQIFSTIILCFKYNNLNESCSDMLCEVSFTFTR